jgi:phosphopantothenoylcysteine decarboxylase / phosphopantothenate---cysteine ligase
MLLKGKRILLGVTGGIAAYKTGNLVRLLIKSGAEVKVIMTASALDFVTPLTLATLSRNPVHHQFFDKENGEWTNHVSLGAWADLFLIAPLTAASLAKLALGYSDDLLSCTYLSSKSPVMVAPAMDLDMYLHPAVKSNLKTLECFGNIVLDAESGELASGLVGQGRMMEPETILTKIIQYFLAGKTLLGKKIMVTAGPTQEALDPVRFISNHSSGKMGIAMAEEAAKRGAEVILILGPTALSAKHPHIKTVPVSSAEEMFQEAASIHGQMDISIFSAAVADYRPAEISKEKIKKSNETSTLDLTKNKDIAHILGGKKGLNQIHVGFALETEEGSESAQNKLLKKNFDFIVLNSLKDTGAGFKSDTNQVTFFFKNKKALKTPVLSKVEVASLIIDEIETLLETTEAK